MNGNIYNRNLVLLTNQKWHSCYFMENGTQYIINSAIITKWMPDTVYLDYYYIWFPNSRGEIQKIKIDKVDYIKIIATFNREQFEQWFKCKTSWYREKKTAAA